MNTYTGIANCYDLLMRGGYYEHDAMAKAVDVALDGRTSVLEIGVGTGMFARSLLDINPSVEITGVDFTPSMLQIAEQRVPEILLVEADVAEMDLARTYDAAISSGGVWVVIHEDGEFMLGTHFFDYGDEVRGLRNVNRHLRPDGLLLLSIQDMHRDFTQDLDDGVRYSQLVSRSDAPGDESFTIDKHYQFTRASQLIAQETLELGFYRRRLMNSIMSLAGFVFEGIDDTNRFFVYRKA